MSSVKAALHTKIESLSEQEARQVMKIVRVLKGKKEASLTLKTLAVDPAFKMPSKRSEPFRAIRPTQGKGIPASELLAKDRR
ncbi:MAG: hypothetical protein HQL08_04715 [Nitrospirae bacterium]|nr:hypothetical protein [Nitrospirota bacterium]